MTNLSLMSKRFRYRFHYKIATETQPESIDNVSVTQSITYTIIQKNNPVVTNYSDPTVGYVDASHDSSGYSYDSDADNNLNSPPIIHIIDPLFGRCSECTPSVTHTEVVQDYDGFFKPVSMSQQNSNVYYFDTADQTERYLYNNGSTIKVSNLDISVPPFYTNYEMILYQAGKLRNNYNYNQMLFDFVEKGPAQTLFRSLIDLNNSLSWDYQTTIPIERIPDEYPYWQVIGANPFIVSSSVGFTYKSHSAKLIY